MCSRSSHWTFPALRRSWSRLNISQTYRSFKQHSTKLRITTVQKLVLRCDHNLAYTFNPFTAPACQISRAERGRDVPADRVFSGPVTHRLSILCVLIKLLSHAKAKQKTKGLKGFEFCSFTGRFQVTSWQ